MTKCLGSVAGGGKPPEHPARHHADLRQLKGVRVARPQEAVTGLQKTSPGFRRFSTPDRSSDSPLNARHFHVGDSAGA
jgi:hypothetical protein